LFMTIRDPKSIIVIFVYLLLNSFIIIVSVSTKSDGQLAVNEAKTLAPEYTEIEKLNYFHLKDEIPQMSLAAESMRSQGETIAEFVSPKGVYNLEEKNKTIKYSALEGVYQKKEELLTLDGEVKVATDEATYTADKLR